MMNRKEISEMKKYKLSAIIGVVIMGIGCFMSCLATSVLTGHVGDALIIISLIPAIYGFSTWNP